MENASKALLIAGGVLITMIVASFGVYLYGVYHEHSENMLAAMSEKEISEYNAKFIIYTGKELTANEVVSIVNLFKENDIPTNSETIDLKYSGVNKLEDSYKLQNYIYNKLIDTNTFIKDLSELTTITIKDETLGTQESQLVLKYYFTLEIEDYDTSGKINKVKIIMGQHKDKKI